VAAGTFETFGFAMNYVSVDGLGDVLVTMTASGLDDLVVEVRNSDVVGVEACREIEGMKKSIRGFNRILADDVMGRVAIVTTGD